MGDPRYEGSSHCYEAALRLRDGAASGAGDDPAVQLARGLANCEAHGYSGRSAIWLAAHAAATGGDPAAFARARSLANDEPSFVAIGLYAAICDAPGAVT